MSKVLINLGLLSWSTLLIGLRRGWASRKDVIDYAVDLVANGIDDEGILLIAGGEHLDNDELLNLMSDQVKPIDNSIDLDKWRLAYLLKIADSDDDEDTKLGRLQEVYADFDYPEDMASCSIYSQDRIDPLEAMLQVIEDLKVKLINKGE